MTNKIETLEKFMTHWEELATSYYVELNKEIKKISDDADSKNLRIVGGVEYKNYKNKYRELSYKRNGLYTLNQIKEAVAKERVRKEANFFARVEKVTGKIVDASNLTIADNMELNGVVVGEEGKVTVNTITAGGYNIQCFHFRVLVKKIN